MRVLALTNLYPTAEDPGRGTFIRSQVESLRRAGIEVDVLQIEGRRGRLEYLRAIPRLRRGLRAHPYDLIHAHYGFSGWVALTQREVPVVISFLGDDVLGTPRADGRPDRSSLLFASIHRRLSSRFAAVIVKSEEMRRRFGDPRAQVIPNGVDLDLFRPLPGGECRTRLALPAGPRRVLFAGDPGIPSKRFELAEAAVRRLRERGTTVELHAIRGRPQDELVLWMNACDALLLTSWSEGSPNVVKEAMACNLPVVGVEVGDLAERLASCAGNRLVPGETGPGRPGRAEETAERLASGLEEVFGAGRTRGRDSLGALSLPAVADRVVSVYREALQEWRANRGA